jgi:predicted nuclease of restriction endonuclease-like (RecB) superfamily
VTDRQQPSDASRPDAADYRSLLDAVALAIDDARHEAVKRTNALVIDLYFRIGRMILARQRDERYGSQLIERLSADLAARFGGTGWSPRNLRYMRAFAAAWRDADENLQARLQHVSWTHHQLLLDRLDTPDVRTWYLDQAIGNRWSSRVLALQIGGRLHERIGRAPTNFAMTLPSVDGDLLDQLATDPRRLDFLDLEPSSAERHVESALVDRIGSFLTHLGRGFAYVGRQFRLTVGDTDFFVDLLFFNVELNCYVLFELKVRAFTPGDAGQLGFYVVAVERQLRRAHHNPTIGVLLVPGKDDVVVEYALASLATPMAVASYTVQDLPADVRDVLPAPRELADAIHDVRLAHESRDPP